MVYKDFKSSFREFLIEDELSLNIHRENLEKLVAEKCLSPELINDVFEFFKKPNSLGTTSRFRSKRMRAIKYSIETPTYLGPELWNLFQVKIKLLNHRQILR